MATGTVREVSLVTMPAIDGLQINCSSDTWTFWGKGCIFPGSKRFALNLWSRSSPCRKYKVRRKTSGPCTQMCMYCAKPWQSKQVRCKFSNEENRPSLCYSNSPPASSAVLRNAFACAQRNVRPSCVKIRPQTCVRQLVVGPVLPTSRMRYLLSW